MGVRTETGDREIEKEATLKMKKLVRTWIEIMMKETGVAMNHREVTNWEERWWLWL